MCVDAHISQLREANEEVALPLHSPHVHVICLLEPLLSVSRLIVTPVVALLSDPSVLDALKPAEGEVACIFNHPLQAFLDPKLAKGETLSLPGTEDWPYDTELHVRIATCIRGGWTLTSLQSMSDISIPVLDNTIHRMHRFQSSASPIKGLTADVLVRPPFQAV